MSDIVWLDLETTGLNPGSDQILEVAAVVTDAELNAKGEFQAVVKTDRSVLLSCDVFVLEMHGRGGLWREAFEARYDLGHVASQLWSWVARTTSISAKPPLGGNSVHFDRAFLKHHMPDVEALFSHRNVDVTSLKELSRRWGGGEPAVSADAHRAMPDILSSIEQARWYRDNLWRRAA